MGDIIYFEAFEVVSSSASNNVCMGISIYVQNTFLKVAFLSPSLN